MLSYPQPELSWYGYFIFVFRLVLHSSELFPVLLAGAAE